MRGEPEIGDYKFKSYKFQLTRPVRGEPPNPLLRPVGVDISTHSPRAGRTRDVRPFARSRADFNSLAPCGANRFDTNTYISLANFNSLAPCGANRCRRRSRLVSGQFQLTRPVRGEPILCMIPLFNHFISTHSPRAGRTSSTRYMLVCCRKFQLTRPVRGEPRQILNDRHHTLISTHSPRAGRTLRLCDRCRVRRHFNSLAPCGANRVMLGFCEPKFAFQLTRPVRGEPLPTGIPK